MPDSLHLYSAPSCPFAQRTRLLLAEKNVDYRMTEIDLQDTPDWFFKISPAGKVPCLSHEGHSLLESAVINEYLEESFPKPRFLPKSAAEKAQVRYWIARTDQALIPAFYKLLMEQKPKRRDKKRQRFETALVELAQGCQGPYFMGKKPTLIDFTLYPFFERLAMLNFYRQVSIPREAEALNDWHQTMQQRDSVKALKRPTEFYIQAYSHYADGSASGITAKEMKEA